MLGKFIKTTKKSIVLTVSGAFAVTAVAHAYQAEEQTYIIQGASPATISQLVENVGGEVIQNIELVNGVSASLTDNEVSSLKDQNSLLRFDNKQKNDELAGIIWGKLGPTGEKYADSQAGIIWGKLGPKGKTKGEKYADSYAGIIWGKLGPKGKTKGEKYADSYAGIIWGKLGPKGKTKGEKYADSYAGIIWGKLGPKKRQVA
jgi:predicted DNA-binding WGR domain protein